MAIKKYFVNRQKDGYQYDRKEKKYFSWGYDIWIDGSRREERGFFTREKAEAAVTALRSGKKDSQHGLSVNRSPYLVELLQKRLDTLTGQERTRAKRVGNIFLKLLPKKIRVTQIKRVHFRPYIEQRQKDGVSAATIRRELVPIVAALNAAGEFYESLENYRPPRIPRPKVPKGRNTKTITFEERQKILGYLFAPRKITERWPKQYVARRRVGLFLQFCLLTVSRPGEVAKLKRSDVDFHAGTVRITGTKTQFVSENPVRSLRMTPTMTAILKERFEKTDGDYLFTRGGKVTGKMYATLKEACEANGIKYGIREIDGIFFNRSRHTGVTVLAQSNLVDTKTAGAFTGHSDETMTLYYTHTNAKLLEIAGEVLEENMGRNLYSGEFLETVSENN